MVKLHTKDEAMMVHAFKKGILSGPFIDSLIRCWLKMFSEIRHQVVAHISAEGKTWKRWTDETSGERPSSTLEST